MKKKQYLKIILILIVILSAFTFNMKLEAGDDLWNFSNIYKMTKGYTIYKDMNVIITPLFFYLGEIFLKMFGTNMMVYKIYAFFIIYLFLFLEIYILYRKMKMKNIDATLFTVAITIITVLIINMASYNMFAITFIILGIINALKYKRNIIDNIIQGIIIFLVFMTKQNIGIYYICGLALSNLLKYKKIKIVFKYTFVQITTFLLLFAMYLLAIKNYNMYDFINYAFLGISEFATENLKCRIDKIIFVVFEVIVSIIMILLTYNKKIKFKLREKINIRTLFPISIFMIAISYPIFNFAHMYISGFVFFISMIYALYIIIIRDIFENGEKQKKRAITIITYIYMVMSICVNIVYFIEINKNDYYFEKTSPYYGTIADKETLKEIENMCNYIKMRNNEGVEVKVIAYYSNLYMNILNKNNGDMDLPFYGNFGKGGEDGFIEKIKQLKNAEILILKEDDEIFQESKKVTNFIRKNYKQTGEIERFLIYTVN